MDDADGARGVVGRRSFKQRLRLSVFGCCGATWGFGRTSAIGAREDEEDQEPQNLPPQERVVITVGQAGPVNIWDPGCVAPVSHGSGMNLAAALAAERQLRAPQDPEGEGSVGPTGNAIAGTPMRVSLMRLIEETEMDGCDPFGGGATALSEKNSGGRDRERFGVLRVYGKEKRRGFHPVWAHILQGVFERGVVESRILSPLQPFDPRGPRYILVIVGFDWMIKKKTKKPENI